MSADHETVLLHLCASSDKWNELGKSSSECFDIKANLEENIGLCLLRQANSAGYHRSQLGLVTNLTRELYSQNIALYIVEVERSGRHLSVLKR